MRRCFFIALLAAGSIAAWPINSHGQDATPAGEVFIGGSKLWEHAAGGHYHDHGLELAVTGNFNRFLGLEMDLSGLGTSLPPSPAYGDYLRILVGPHFAYDANSRVSPFSHVLVGLTHGRQDCDSLNPPPDCNTADWERGGNAFTATVGAGLDVKVFRFFWVRPIQVDYLHVLFPNAAENNLQLSCGFTFRFGSLGRTGKH
ncbi:MAG TPA: hypothetical protein VKM93_10400 [Terriglobia bacterium]|nr:hypothetical protein [Terriglobia bacterium]